MQVAKGQLEALGASVEMVKNPAGTQTFPDGRKAEYPEIILARLGTDPAKKTLLVYGHLDVQPAKLEGEFILRRSSLNRLFRRVGY